MSKLPLPGTAVRGSKTGKPIMALMDLLGRSWSMGIIWHLSEGPANFRLLQLKCGGVSPSVLNRRLKELRSSGLVEHNQEGYLLTETGNELYDLLYPLGRWSDGWASKIDEAGTAD